MWLLQKTGWIILILLAIVVGCYPVLYFINPLPFGILTSKSPELTHQFIYQVGFYGHIIPGGIALLTGWSQFIDGWRTKYAQAHRTIGKVYIICVCISAASAIYISLDATGGIIATLGFAGLGFTWLVSTLIAYMAIRRGNVDLHQRWMIMSYAACLSAVTLRIYLPLLVYYMHNFILAYRLVAWLCWVPNIIVGCLIQRKINAPKMEIPS